MEKIVYTVRGNHDGNIGVYSSPKKAWAKAVEYVQAPEQTYNEFRNCLAENKDNYNVIFSVEAKDTSAEITKFFLNY